MHRSIFNLVAAGTVSFAAASIVVAQLAPAPTTAPAATQPAAPDDYERLLGSEADIRDRPLLPQGRSSVDRTTGAAAIAPGAPEMSTRREGTFVVDRVGRLVKAADGHGWEFVFVADGNTMQDPPVRVVPNLKLQTIEDEMSVANRDLKLRVSGTLTEYRGRNYVILEKVIVVRDGV